MKLAAKVLYPKEVKRQEYKPVSSSLKKLPEDPEAIIPNGVHKGQTLQWLKENETMYYKWMKDKDLIQQWGLVRSIPVEQKTNNDEFTTSSGETWLYLYTTENE